MSQITRRQKTVACAGEVGEEFTEHGDSETLLRIKQAALRLLSAFEKTVDEEAQENALLVDEGAAKTREQLIHYLHCFS